MRPDAVRSRLQPRSGRSARRTAVRRPPDDPPAASIPPLVRRCAVPGNRAVFGRRSPGRSLALRPRLSTGLPSLQTVRATTDLAAVVCCARSSRAAARANGTKVPVGALREPKRSDQRPDEASAGLDDSFRTASASAGSRSGSPLRTPPWASRYSIGGRVERPREIEALGELAAQRAQATELRPLLHAFGDDRQLAARARGPRWRSRAPTRRRRGHRRRRSRGRS